MIFANNKEVAKMEASWQAVLLNIASAEDKRVFFICGPKGSGKTKIAQDYVRSHANAFYISFGDLSEQEALEAFHLQYVPEASGFSDWNEAADAFIKKRNKRATFLIFENEYSAAMHQCGKAFANYIYLTHYVRACYISSGEKQYWDEVSLDVKYRTLQDYFNAFPNYSRQDLIRLYALTGGILCVAKELDDQCGFEENVRHLLAYDSAFTNTLPIWLAQSFRSPESYYPIFKSIAGGHHRLSEIAKDIGFPNNKCGKYLEALIRHEYVIAEKTESGKQSTYHLANSYYVSWARYAYGKSALQVGMPDKLYEYVINDIDSTVALPAFLSSCMRFIDRAAKDFLFEYRASKVESTQKALSIKTPDGQGVVLDLCVQTDDAMYVFIFPHSLDTRYTKAEIENIYDALRHNEYYYNTHITIFSIERFSDWCVHETARNEWLHEVTLERLKY